MSVPTRALLPLLAMLACNSPKPTADGERSRASPEPGPSASSAASGSASSAASPSAMVLGELQVPLTDAPGTFDEILPDTTGSLSPGMLRADLGKASTEAARLTAPLPGLVDWLDTAEFRVPNPGWRVFKRSDAGIFLAAPDGQGDLIVHLFDDQRDLDALLGSSPRLSRWRWREARPVTLGPDALPALVGTGEATSAAGGTIAILYALVRGGAQSLLILCTTKPQGGEADRKAAAGIIANVKRQSP